MFTPTRYVVGVATRTYKRDDHYSICTKLLYGCPLALCGPMWTFPHNFFFCLVCQLRLLVKKKKKKVNHAHLGHRRSRLIAIAE